VNADHSETTSGTPESGIVYVYRFLDDGTAASLPCEQVNEALATPGGWTWVHIGLADARARKWIARHAPVSETAREVLAKRRRAHPARHPRQRDHRGHA